MKLKIDKLMAVAAAFRRDGNVRDAARACREIADALPTEWVAQYNAGAVCLEAGELETAVHYLERAITLHPCADALNLYAHVLALQGQMAAARAAYEHTLMVEPRDFSAHWGLFEVLQLLDDNTGALKHQRDALKERTLITINARVQPPRLTVLELCIAGTFQANIPLDFIIDNDHVTVHKLFLGEHRVPDRLPPHDIVFNTIAEATNALASLEDASRFIARRTAPALNDPELVPLTSRLSVARLFADSHSIVAASTIRIRRNAVMTHSMRIPFLIRPLDSHAGNDLAKIDNAGELVAYLAATPEVGDFYLTKFIDYRNADGYYRKYRIVFVDGIPYPVHMAISPKWMIHYYNAPMAENAWMRDEEHAFMRDMDSVFGGIRAAALREIVEKLPLDYFGVDCSIAPDGRVLLFEASTAMIVHMRDSVELYPYKRKYVPRVIDALQRLFEKHRRPIAVR